MAGAITLIFASGHLPLIQALNGKRRSLPGVPLVDRIAEELRPLGPQFLGDAWAKAVLPAAQDITLVVYNILFLLANVSK